MRPKFAKLIYNLFLFITTSAATWPAAAGILVGNGLSNNDLILQYSYNMVPKAIMGCLNFASGCGADATDQARLRQILQRGLAQGNPFEVNASPSLQPNWPTPPAKSSLAQILSGSTAFHIQTLGSQLGLGDAAYMHTLAQKVADQLSPLTVEFKSPSISALSPLSATLVNYPGGVTAPEAFVTDGVHTVPVASLLSRQAQCPPPRPTAIGWTYSDPSWAAVPARPGANALVFRAQVIVQCLDGRQQLNKFSYQGEALVRRDPRTGNIFAIE